jgi:hypothetical protein
MMTFDEIAQHAGHPHLNDGCAVCEALFGGMSQRENLRGEIWCVLRAVALTEPGSREDGALADLLAEATGHYVAPPSYGRTVIADRVVRHFRERLAIPAP